MGAHAGTQVAYSTHSLTQTHTHAPTGSTYAQRAHRHSQHANSQLAKNNIQLQQQKTEIKKRNKKKFDRAHAGTQTAEQIEHKLTHINTHANRQHARTVSAHTHSQLAQNKKQN